jgi:hypothetical protein
MSPVETSGEWNEWRVYVLATLADVKEEQRRQAEAAARSNEAAMVLSEVKTDKQSKDIQAAHNKIRSLTLKNWIITATAVVLFEVVKWGLEVAKGYLHK